jgi:hypothetical protein
MKGHLRRNCRHTLKALRENIIAALEPENIPLTLVQKWFRKMRDYMAAYEAGATGATADKAVKQYKSEVPQLAVLASASTRRRRRPPPPAEFSHRDPRAANGQRTDASVAR